MPCACVAAQLVLLLATTIIAGTRNLVHVPGTFMIGGLFPLRQHDEASGECLPELTVDGVLSLHTFLYSLKRANELVLAHSNVSLGAIALDSCGSDRHATLQAFSLVYGSDETNRQSLQLPLLNNKGSANCTLDEYGLKSLVGVVGPSSSSVAIQTASILGLFKVPQISYAATSPTLNNLKMFPYFLRTVPSDEYQAECLVELLLKQNWTHIIGLFESTDYGREGFRKFQQLASQNAICFALEIQIDVQPNYQDLIWAIRNSSTQVVVAYTVPKTLQNILRAVTKDALFLQNIIWIGTDGWGGRDVEKEFNAVFEGALSTQLVHGVLDGFEEYVFQKTSDPAQPNYDWLDSSLAVPLRKDDIVRFSYTYSIWNAVFAFAHALRSMLTNFDCPDASDVSLCLKTIVSNSSMLLDNLRAVKFIGADDTEFSFFQGQGRAVYDILNFQHGSWKKVGQVAQDSNHGDTKRQFQLTYDTVPIFKATNPSYPQSTCGPTCGWNQIRRYIDKCRWTCEECPFMDNDKTYYKSNENSCEPCERYPRHVASQHSPGCVAVPISYIEFYNPLTLVVVMVATLGFLLTVSSLILFLIHRHTPIIKAAGRELSIVMLVGIFMCYGVIFLILARPSVVLCAIARCMYSLGYTVCYAAIFIKTNRIARIFLTPKKGAGKRAKYISPASQLLLVSFLIGIQAAIDAVWLILRKPEPQLHEDIDYQLETIRIFQYCVALENEDILVGLTFPFLLLIFTSIYAFKSRKCPGRFNETKYISITCYTACLVWLTFIPVFFSMSNIYTRMFVFCGTIVINATVTLICLFGPKLYVAVLRPHKNTKETVMGRKTTLATLSSVPVVRNSLANTAAGEIEELWEFVNKTSGKNGQKLSLPQISKQSSQNDSVFSDSLGDEVTVEGASPKEEIN